MYFLIAVLLFGVVPLAAQSTFSRNVREHANTLAPFVSSPPSIVDKMLDMADIRPGETVYDLGCGDGRVLITAAQRFRAKGVGVELSGSLARMAEQKVKQMSLADQIQIIHGHLLDVNLQSADVVTLYLETKSNEMLRPNLEKYLHPGARVVSHDFEVRGWKPLKVEKIQSYNRDHRIYLYQMPPQKN